MAILELPERTVFLIPLIFAFILTEVYYEWKLCSIFKPRSNHTTEDAILTDCYSHKYSVEIISLDPLFMYINDFISPDEALHFSSIGLPLLAPSEVYPDGGDSSQQRDPESRTSKSAGLAHTDPLVNCVLFRAQKLMGTLLPAGRSVSELFERPQVVHYEQGEKFTLHHDWYRSPRELETGTLVNRLASFFVFLSANCTEGETWFPFIDGRKVDGVNVDQGRWTNAEGRFIEGKQAQGTIFRPVAGSSLFWMNLREDGTGDPRVLHAGLPVRDGTKTGLNIWARKYFE